MIAFLDGTHSSNRALYKYTAAPAATGGTSLSENRYVIPAAVNAGSNKYFRVKVLDPVKKISGCTYPVPTAFIEHMVSTTRLSNSLSVFENILFIVESYLSEMGFTNEEYDSIPLATLPASGLDE